MDKASIARLIVAILTAFNTVLTALGKPVIPDELVNAIVIIAGFAFEVFTMWKNNYITKKGKAQKDILKRNNLA